MIGLGLFYTTSDKELLADRHKIFKEVGIPSLGKNGFSKSPFRGTWFGEYDRNINGYSYELCRLSNSKYLEIIDVTVVRGDKWIKVDLNIFEIEPSANSIEEFNGLDGLSFHLANNGLTKMRLRSDEYKGPPLFYMFHPEHKIGTYNTKRGYQRALTKLRELIEKDMSNIGSFVKKWNEIYKPRLTTWEGKPL